jgi:hypothetical protein
MNSSKTFSLTCLRCGSDDVTVYDGVTYYADEDIYGDAEGRYEFSGPSFFCNCCGNDYNIWTEVSDVVDGEFEIPGQMCLWE